MHKGREVVCHIDLISVLKYNYVEDYNMDNEIVCNGRGPIPSDIRITRGMINVEDVRS